MSRVARAAVVFLACSAGVGVFFVGAVAASGGRSWDPAGAGARGRPSVSQLSAPGSNPAALGSDRVRGRGEFANDLTLVGTGSVSFSAVVKPNGRATTAYFEFGLATRYREPRPSHVVYDEATQMVHLSADFQSHLVSGTASGLVPNALYHLRLVASSSAGTIYSHDATFRTLKDPPPPAPLIGARVNVERVSGLVLIQPPRANLLRSSKAARLVEGWGFIPLTERRELSIHAQIDARAGALRMVVAGPRPRHTGRVTLAGGLFSLSQARRGPAKGLTTLDLLEGDFRGAPSDNRCPGHASTPGVRTPSSLVLQSLRASDQRGRLRTRGRYSSATARHGGTAWDTIDRCDGTVTVVHRGTVIVHEFALGKTIAVHAGQRHLAGSSRGRLGRALIA